MQEADELVNEVENNVGTFAAMVREMCTKQDQMKDLAAQRKVLADEVKELRDSVMGYMIENKVKKCNYENDEIYVNKKEAAGPLNRAVLKNALDEFFETEDQSKEEAEECFAFIIDSLGKKEVTELKRTKRKAPKKAAVGDGNKKTKVDDEN